MHRELRNGWSCRPERNLSGGQSGKRKKKAGGIKRGMAYFLTFLMLVGNVQTVAYEEESARELAGSIHREEAAVDITFYHEENGEEKEVQPKAGKKVDVRFQKTEKREKVLSDEEKELQLVHLPEGLPVEILPLKEERDDLLFFRKTFQPDGTGSHAYGRD